MAKQLKTWMFLILIVFTGLLAGGASLLLWVPAALGAEPSSIALTIDPGVLHWGFAAAAAATGLSSLAAGYAVAAVGSAGIGALAEKPELMGRILVLVGLAEGIAIYGVIISILILNRLA
ncbi:MAG: H+transporting two-sector ATPase C subunit [Gammaproteobacteria bacterium]|nr:H+transporting two-sector ATPase C subunit [Gammaproteobacteria bacterium]